MTHTPRLPRFAGLPLAVVAGLAIPVQGRINGALGVRLNDGIAAAVVGFSIGLVVMILISLAAFGIRGERALGIDFTGGTLTDNQVELASGTIRRQGAIGGSWRAALAARALSHHQRRGTAC